MKIKNREFTSILITLICVKMLFTYPRFLVEEGENGAWIAVLVWGGLAAAIYYVTQRLYLKTGCISILSQCEAIGGKWLKAAMGILVLVILTANIAPVIRAFPEAIKTALLQKTSMEVIAVLLTVGVVIGAYCGICALGRTAALFLPVAALFILGFFIILVPHCGFNNLFPTALVKNLTNSDALSVYSDIFAVNLLLPYADNSKCVTRTAFLAIVISVAASGAILLAYCLSYSYPASKSFFVPMYQLARLVKIGVYFQRLESVFEFVWSIAIFIYTSVYLFLICDVFRRSFGFGEYKPFIIPAVQILMFFVFRGESYVTAFSAPRTVCGGLFALLYILPLAVGGIYLRRMRK